ncbi:hypothetical protein HPB47_013181 [Ixodes persulcatus]|uniref:Uncharacterized protein n=1 Tax=Ixodes persulcatus TaxID=34615 RepID=A0AC60NRG6_IXOPE|nr:hypothetical protein HPB47_013181 [Ixodes persulcatus]
MRNGRLARHASSSSRSSIAGSSGGGPAAAGPLGPADGRARISGAGRRPDPSDGPREIRRCGRRFVSGIVAEPSIRPRPTIAPAVGTPSLREGAPGGRACLPQGPFSVHAAHQGSRN